MARKAIKIIGICFLCISYLIGFWSFNVTPDDTGVIRIFGLPFLAGSYIAIFVLSHIFRERMVITLGKKFMI
jgi:hypothetical protein